MIPNNAAGFQRVWFEDAEGNRQELPSATIIGMDVALDESLDHTEIVVVSSTHAGSYEVVGRFYTSDRTHKPSDAPSLSQKKHITGREPGTVKRVDKLEGLDAAR